MLTGTATYSTTGFTFMLAAKSKVLIPLVLLLCTLPLALQHVMTSNARSTQADARADQAPSPRVTKRSDRSEVLSVEEFCKRLAAAKKNNTEDGVRRSIRKETSGFSADQGHFAGGAPRDDEAHSQPP